MTPMYRSAVQDVLNDFDKYEDHIKQWVAMGPFADKTIESGEQSYKQVYEPEQADTSKLEWKPLQTRYWQLGYRPRRNLRTDRSLRGLCSHDDLVASEIKRFRSKGAATTL